MAKPTKLYIVCTIMFPFAFAGFVVGFACPVWLECESVNKGLWQKCSPVFKDCTDFDFDEDGDWMIGTRAVEIFALVMLALAAAEIVYENVTGFGTRNVIERTATGCLSILGGAGGLAGVVVYTVNTNDLKDDSAKYGWALILVAASAGLAMLLGVGFYVSGCCLENLEEDPHKKPINAYSSISDTSQIPPPGQPESYAMTAFPTRSVLHSPISHPEFGPSMFNSSNSSLHSQRNMALPILLPPQSGGPLSEVHAPRADPHPTSYYSPGPDFDLSDGYQAGRPVQYGRDEDDARFGRREGLRQFGRDEDDARFGRREGLRQSGRSEDDARFGRREGLRQSGRGEDDTRFGRREGLRQSMSAAASDPYSRWQGRDEAEDAYPHQEEAYYPGYAMRGPALYGHPTNTGGFDDPYRFDRRGDGAQLRGEVNRAYTHGQDHTRRSEGYYNLQGRF